MGGVAILPLLILDAQNPLTPFWLVVTTFFETGLGFSAYFVYVKIIPSLQAKAQLTSVPDGVRLQNPIARLLIAPTIYKVPNRWWIRLLFFRGLSFVIIVTVALRIALSTGWRNPFVSTAPLFGLPSMPGWVWDLVYSRSTNEPNSAHLVSYIGIPIIAIYSMWKFKDEFMGPLMGAFFVAIHESIWEAFYYLGYSQYLSWAVITNVLKDVSFSSMVVLFLLAFWKYPKRQIPMREFIFPVILYASMVAAWFFVPAAFGYGFFPITTINNFLYGKGVYSQTNYWADPTVNLLEIFSWFGLFLMLQYVLMRWKPEHP